MTRSRRLPKQKGPVILVHGGAGMRVVTVAQKACLADALLIGHAVLQRGGSALDAVETAIRVLEGSGLFNAGIGSFRQLDGICRMDAAIMEGRALRAGAVAGIERIRHPISAARLVMQETLHVLLVGSHATRFARQFNLQRQPSGPRRPLADQRRALRAEAHAGVLHRRTFRLYEKILGQETVGAVALDRAGNLAAGASTGGITCMLPGRVGDTPLIGCGVYADNEAGAVSMTGLGESIIRIAVAKEIIDRLAGNSDPARAAKLTLTKLVARIKGGAAGTLVLTSDGRFAIRHTTPRMCAGWWDGKGMPTVKDRFR